MDNVQQAAIILLGMGEQYAAEILKRMDQKQVEKLIACMNKLGDITETEVIKALNGFFQETGSNTGMGVSSGNYMRNALIGALGVEKANSLIDRAELSETAYGLEMLNWQRPQIVANILQDEHPQICAVSLTYLSSEKAAAVLATLESGKRIDVLKRMTNIGPISPAAIEDLSGMFEHELTQKDNFKEIPMGGIDAAADILNFIDTEVEQEVLSKLAEQDQELATQIQDRMFPFEKLITLDDRSLQTLLRDISNEDLTLALKGVDPEIQNKFFKSMSERAADMLKDDLEAQGPVQLCKVQEAQKKVSASSQQMAKDGKIVLSAKGNDDVVM